MVDGLPRTREGGELLAAGVVIDNDSGSSHRHRYVTENCTLSGRECKNGTVRPIALYGQLLISVHSHCTLHSCNYI